MRRNILGLWLVASALATGAPAFAGEVTVAPGQTLSQIAAKYLGDSNRWAEICRANSPLIRDCNNVPAGLVLRIDSDEAGAEAQSAVAADPNAPAEQTATGPQAETPPIADTGNVVPSDQEIGSLGWNGYWVRPEVTLNQPDPLGGMDAVQLATADGLAGRDRPISGLVLNGALPPGDYTVSVWVRTLGTSPLPVNFGINDEARTDTFADNKWKQLSQDFTLTRESLRVFQIFETSVNNSAWEIFQPTVRVRPTVTQNVAAPSNIP